MLVFFDGEEASGDWSDTNGIYGSRHLAEVWKCDGTRQLNRYINLPEEWTSKPTSGLQTFMIEGLQYAGLDRNIDTVCVMAAYPIEVLDWPRTG